MSLLRLAVTTQRWDLAAHVIVLASVRAVLRSKKNAEKKRTKQARRKKGR